MAQCPNCSRQASRTKDWACQWCGYPLLSGSFKEIPKTYRQLKEEGLNQPEATPKPEVIPESEPEQKPEPETTQEIELEIKPLAEPKEEPYKETEKEEEPVVEAEPEPEPEPEAPAIVLTVDEILKEYAEDESAADARFVKKLLEVNGTVTMIDVKDILDTHYIRISGAEDAKRADCYCKGRLRRLSDSNTHGELLPG